MDLISFKNFKGKALVVFRTTRICHYVHDSLHKPWYNVGRPTGTKHYIKGKFIELKHIGPPEDMKFEHFHYPKSKRILRNIAVFVAATALFLAALWFFLIVLGKMNLKTNLDNAWHNRVIRPKDGTTPVTQTPKTWLQWIHEIIEPFYMTIFVLTIGFFIGTCYGKIQSWKISPNSRNIQLSLFNIGYANAIINFLIIQSFFASIAGSVTWLIGIKTMIESMLFKKILFKAIDMAITNREPTAFIKICHILIGSSKQFNLYGGIDNLIPLAFLAFTFYALNPFLIAPMSMLTLYVVAAIDKYRMLKICEFPEYKSRSILVPLFATYKLFPFLFFWGSLNILRVFDVDFYQGELLTKYRYMLVIVIFGAVLYIVSIFVFPQTIGKDISENFVEKHGAFEYEEARKEFTSCYRVKYPFSSIHSADPRLVVQSTNLAALQTADLGVNDIFMDAGAMDTASGVNGDFAGMGA